MSLTFKDPPNRDHPNFLLYGPPKTGKTLAAASMPGRLLYLNTDLDNATVTAHERNPGMMEAEFEGMKTMLDVAELVRQDDPPVDVVVLDTVSDCYRLLLEEFSNDAVRPTLPQRGDVVSHLERFCRLLCKAKVMVVLVCHELILETDGQATRTLPYTGTSKPTLGLKLAGMVDVLAYTAVLPIDDEHEQERYVGQLRDAHGRLGGDRFDGVLGPWRETNLAEWLEVIQGAKPATTGATPEKEQVQ